MCLLMFSVVLCTNNLQSPRKDNFKDTTLKATVQQQINLCRSGFTVGWRCFHVLLRQPQYQHHSSAFSVVVESTWNNVPSTLQMCLIWAANIRRSSIQKPKQHFSNPIYGGASMFWTSRSLRWSMQTWRPGELTLSSLSCSFGHSWTVFAVFQGALSCCHCHGSLVGAAGPLASTYLFLMGWLPQPFCPEYKKVFWSIIIIRFEERNPDVSTDDHPPFILTVSSCDRPVLLLWWIVGLQHPDDSGFKTKLSEYTSLRLRGPGSNAAVREVKMEVDEEVKEKSDWRIYSLWHISLFLFLLRTQTRSLSLAFSPHLYLVEILPVWICCVCLQNT